jgi:hypothetical protein
MSVHIVYIMYQDKCIKPRLLLPGVSIQWYPSPHPKEPGMHTTVSSAFSRRRCRVAASLAASPALGAPSVHAAIGQKDETDNFKAMETTLAMPVLAIAATKAFGPNMAVVIRNAATNVQEVVVPNAVPQ